MELSDESLVEQCLDGDPEAFALLVDRYRTRVFSVLLRMVGNWEDAQDLAQEAFVRAYNGLHTFDGSQRFAPWLFRVATNHCISALRRKRLPTVPLVTEEDGEAREIQLPDLSGDPETVLLRRERSREIEDAVLALPERYRAAVLLYHMEEMSYEEIAQVLGVPLNTVRTYLHRARAQLRQALQGALA